MTRPFTARELGLSRADVQRLTAGATKPAVTAKRAKAPSLRPWHPYRSKWEREYAHKLEVEKAAGLVLDWQYEPRKFEIGVGALFTPDFLVVTADGFSEWHEVKGFKREAAMVRLRSAARQYPNETFRMVTKRMGIWHRSTICPAPPSARRDGGTQTTD